uniref:Cytochrome c oxidase subunit 7C, mitochondrial n=1 Tax=Monodelphis domestica TaxID=13616 RepID=A0A5F8H285_MONDO
MLGQSVRRFSTSLVRWSHYEEGPGKFSFKVSKYTSLLALTKLLTFQQISTNLPFSVENKWRLLAMMAVYFGSGFAAPFLIVRHQLLKK